MPGLGGLRPSTPPGRQRHGLKAHVWGRSAKHPPGAAGCSLLMSALRTCRRMNSRLQRTIPARGTRLRRRVRHQGPPRHLRSQACWLLRLRAERPAGTVDLDEAGEATDPKEQTTDNASDRSRMSRNSHSRGNGNYSPIVVPGSPECRTRYEPAPALTW